MKIRTSLKAILVLVGALCLLFYPASSKADSITVPSTPADWKGYITSDHMDPGPNSAGTPPFGYVELWQINTDTVDLRVTLDPGNKFVSTGSGNFQDFLFNMTGGLGVGNITIEQNALYDLHASAGPFSADGLGPMGFGIRGYITYPNDPQPIGGGDGFTTPIIFQVYSATGVTIAQLTTPNPIIGGKGGNIFGIDMFSGQTGLTGLVDVSQEGVPFPVPEPGILILLGIAMSAIGMASWRISKI